MKKIAFVLSGGGAAGAIQVGAMKALLEAGVVPSFLAGTSAGALNSFAYGFGGFNELMRIWNGISKESDIFSGNTWVTLPWRSGLKDPEPLRKKLQAVYDKFKHAKSVSTPFTVTTVSLVSGEIRYTPSSDPDIVNMTCASASIPGYVEGYQEETLDWCDGGIKENLPLSQGLAYRPEAIICLHCYPENPRSGDSWKTGGIAHRGLRALTMAMEENYKADRLVCGSLGVPIIDIHPEAKIIDTFDFNAAKIQQAIGYQYVSVRQKIDAIKTQLGL